MYACELDGSFAGGSPCLAHIYIYIFYSTNIWLDLGCWYFFQQQLHLTSTKMLQAPLNSGSLNFVGCWYGKYPIIYGPGFTNMSGGCLWDFWSIIFTTGEFVKVKVPIFHWNVVKCIKMSSYRLFFKGGFVNFPHPKISSTKLDKSQVIWKQMQPADSSGINDFRYLGVQGLQEKALHQPIPSTLSDDFVREWNSVPDRLGLVYSWLSKWRIQKTWFGWYNYDSTIFF